MFINLSPLPGQKWDAMCANSFRISSLLVLVIILSQTNADVQYIPSRTEPEMHIMLKLSYADNIR